VVDPLRGGPDARDFAQLRATLLLQRLPGVGDAGLDPLVERFGSAAAALSASREAFAAVVGSAAAARRTDEVLRRRVDEALHWCRVNRVSVVHRWAADYPARLQHVPNPPGALFFQGDRSLLDPEIVTVVGSRKSTEYGRRVAREVAVTAARHGAVVASGLALGIDGEAHRACIDAGGRTLAVLGAGFQHPYPRLHVPLFRQIAREGLLVTEFLPGERPLPYHFPRRNRVLAALAQVVVVVEAAEDSGALNTASHALDLGRDLLAVPGPIYAAASRGTNRLLRNAAPLLSPATVLEYLSGPGPEALSLFPERPPEDLGADALSVWDALAETAKHVDALSKDARLAAGRTLAALSLLEVTGWVRQESGARFVRVTDAAATRARAQ